MPEARNLKIFSTFRCTADQCPDNCCDYNWNIDIDPETLARWRGLTDEATRTYLLDSIDRTATAVVFKQNQQGDCIHLDGNKLCQIHGRFGPELLPQVCHAYPRLYLKSVDRVSNSVQLSCPEVARLLLQAEDDALFDIESCAEGQALDASTVNPLLLEINRIMVDYFERLPFSETLPVGAYLYDISDILIFLTQATQASNFSPDKLAKRCGPSRKMVQKRLQQTIAQAQAGKAGPTQTEIFMYWGLIHDLYQQRPIANIDALLGEADSGANYWPLAQALFATHSGSDMTKLQQQAAQQSDKIKLFGRQVQASLRRLERHLGINKLLLRYLQVKFHNHGFPWRPFKGNYTATFLDCVIPFSIVVHLLVGLESSGVNVDQALLQDVIYRVERRFTHNTSIFELLHKQPAWMNLSAYHRVFLQMGL